MAGGPLQDSMIGVGPALRKARERRGITLDAASRDTKLHVSQLEALEAEDFDALLGDVYVRGSLRSYARYLGLDADKVIGAYARHADEPEPPPPPAKLGRVERAIAATRVRDNQRLMVVLACLVLLGAVVFGLLSRSHSAPAPALLPTAAAQPEPLDREIAAVVVAIDPVDVTVRADGVLSRYSMAAGETRTFIAQTRLWLALSEGGTVRLTVNGVDKGIPGQLGHTWSNAYRYTSDTGGATSSPGG